jgi:hypothetical protein
MLSTCNIFSYSIAVIFLLLLPIIAPTPHYCSYSPNIAPTPPILLLLPQYCSYSSNIALLSILFFLPIRRSSYSSKVAPTLQRLLLLLSFAPTPQFCSYSSVLLLLLSFAPTPQFCSYSISVAPTSNIALNQRPAPILAVCCFFYLILST